MAPFFHLSVDDVFASLMTASDRGQALATAPMIGVLDRLHDEFATRIDLYLFGEDRIDGVRRRLDALSPAIVAELRVRPWLRLGPHAADPQTPPHRQTVDDLSQTLHFLYGVIDRMAGPQARSRWVRLHEFSEAYEAAPTLKAHGVEALLTTDKPVGAWRLPPAERDMLLQRGRTVYGGIEFVRSHLRVESLIADGIDRTTLLDRVGRLVEAHGFVTIFTHEICFNDARTTTMLHGLLDACRALGLESA